MTILMTLILGTFFAPLVTPVPVITVDSFEQLPAAVHQLPDDMYVQWIKIHNRLASEKARQHAGDLRSAITTITSNRYDQVTIRDYHSPRWGGGPVLILNPYYRK